MVTQSSTLEVNRRDIRHLGYTPFEIHFGYQPPSMLESTVPTYDRVQANSFFTSTNVWDKLLNESDWNAGVFDFIVNRQEVRTRVAEASNAAKVVQKERHDMGVRTYSFEPGQMVMLYDTKSAKKKLHPAYRGPFIVTGFGGSHDRSYTLSQVNGVPIPRTYYGDHLKPFKLREGYLQTQYEEFIKSYQNIRAGRSTFKVPRGGRVSKNE